MFFTAISTLLLLQVVGCNGIGGNTKHEAVVEQRNYVSILASTTKTFRNVGDGYSMKEFYDSQKKNITRKKINQSIYVNNITVTDEEVNRMDKVINCTKPYKENGYKAGDMFTYRARINDTEKQNLRFIFNNKHARLRRSQDISCVDTCPNSRHCQCDDDCNMYGDCCVNAPGRLVSYPSFQFSQDCIPVENGNGIWVISNCPNRNIDPVIAEKCLSSIDRYGDIYHGIPVVSKSQKRYFKNQFCAFCHGVTSEDDISFLHVEIVGFLLGCNLKSTLSGKDLLIDLFQQTECFPYFKSVELIKGRRCFPNLVSSCQSQYTDSLRKNDSVSDVVDSCEKGHFLPVFESSNEKQISYKNINCWKCNQRLSNYLKCGIYNNLDVIPVSLRVLLNMSQIFPPVTASLQHCNADEVFDQKEQTCKRVHCGINSVFRNGKCESVVQEILDIPMMAYITFQVKPAVPPLQLLDLIHRHYTSDVFKGQASVFYTGIIQSNEFQNTFTSLVHLKFVYNKSFKNIDDVFNDENILQVQKENWQMKNVYTSSKTYHNISTVRDNGTCGSNKSQDLEDCISTPQILIVSNSLKTKDSNSLACPYVYIRDDNAKSNLTQNTVETTSKEKILCLEDFILLQSQTAVSEPHSQFTLDIILTYGSFSLSIICGAIFVTVFVKVPSIRTLPTKTIFNLVLTTLLFQCLYVVGVGVTEYPMLCQIIGIALHYIWLSTFTWSVICAYHMFRVFKKIQVCTIAFESSVLIIYMSLGYGLPFIYTTVFVVGHVCRCYPLEISYGPNVCFLSTRLAIISALDIPVAISLLTNIVLFLRIAKIIKKQSSIQRTMSNRERNSFLICVRIVSTMNFSWILGLLAKWTDIDLIWYAFSLVNGLQGLFLTLSFITWKDLIQATRNCNTGDGITL